MQTKQDFAPREELTIISVKFPNASYGEGSLCSIVKQPHKAKGQVNSDLRNQTINSSFQVHCLYGVVQAVVQETLHGHLSQSLPLSVPLSVFVSLSLATQPVYPSLSSLVSVTLSYSWIPH